MFRRVRPQIPMSKDVVPLLELDRDEKKLDVFLTMHRNNLLVSDLKIFLPFTINLDPYLKKVIKGMYRSSTTWTKNQTKKKKKMKNLLFGIIKTGQSALSRQFYFLWRAEAVLNVLRGYAT